MPPKEKHLEPGDVVYHKGAGEPQMGIVIAARLVEVDWGPEIGAVVHPEYTLSAEHIPKFGAG